MNPWERFGLIHAPDLPYTTCRIKIIPDRDSIKVRFSLTPMVGESVQAVVAYSTLLQIPEEIIEMEVKRAWAKVLQKWLTEE